MDKCVDKIATTTTTTMTTTKQIYKAKKRMEQANGIKVNLQSSQNANVCLLFFELFKLWKRRRRKSGKENAGCASAQKQIKQNKKTVMNEWNKR